jgi:putative transposase
MPRKPRFYLPGIPAHVIQRGNSRQAVFFSDEDYTAYLDWLKEGAEKHGCALHAYVLMTNHVHLLMTPQTRDAISKTIQFVGRHYVTYINHTYGRSGTLWEGRHKGCLISSEEYLFSCMRYIEMNPVRAGMVDTPAEYPWSSYRWNATRKENEMLVPHPDYRALGHDSQDRAQAWAGPQHQGDCADRNAFG